MCLQWCHVTSLLIDNDLPCTWCPRFRQGAPRDQSCASCAHRVDRLGRTPFCGLSKAELPLLQTCCHWNARRESRPLLHLGPIDIAPGVLEAWNAPSVVALFERSETAHGYVSDRGGQVQVALADLALPLVYGVVAAQWDDALSASAEGRTCGPDVAAPPEIAVAVLQLLDALDEMAEGDAAHGHAADLLARHQAEALPAPWPALVTEALHLYRGRAAASSGGTP